MTIRRSDTALALLASLVLLASASPAPAGEKGYKCTMDTQKCLDEMVARLKTSGWLGIEYEMRSDSGLPGVTKVVGGSPAEAAGFKKGDVLVSVNGARFADNTSERCVTCDRVRDVWKPGAKMRYVVRRDGKDVTLDPTLAALPPDVMAMMIGMHMLEHAQPIAEGKSP